MRRSCAPRALIARPPARSTALHISFSVPQAPPRAVPCRPISGVVKVGKFKPKAVLEVSEAAQKRLQELVSDAGPAGLNTFRLGVKSRGCNGMSYTLELTDKVSKLDEIVEANGAALLSVFGTKMDYVTEGDLKSEFIFVNPNAKSTCGCGESFNI